MDIIKYYNMAELEIKSGLNKFRAINKSPGNVKQHCLLMAIL